jgi:hypothetical protein
MDCIGFSRIGMGRHGRWLSALLLFTQMWTSAAAPPTPPRHTTSASPSRATPAKPRPAPDGHRFLFVVDISAPMRATDAANRQALFDMLFTGLDGQMRSGDTFGLWLYNEKLHAGGFPMQIWDEKDPLPAASLATKFLRDQPYAGTSRPGALMPSLFKLIENVHDVNVLVISSGKPALKGTPFDTNIAAIVSRKRNERETAQKPFVTALVARGGTIVTGAVVIAGEPLLLPERPAAVLAAKGTNAPAQPAKPKGIVHSISTSEGRIQSTEVLGTGVKPGTAPANSEPSSQTTATLAPQDAAPPKSKVLQIVTRTDAVTTNAAAVPAPTSENSIPITDFSWTGIDLGIGNPRLEAAVAKLQPVAAAAKPEPTMMAANPERATGNPESQKQTMTDAAPATPSPSILASLENALSSEPVPVAARSPGTSEASAAPVVALAPTPRPSAALLLTIGIVLLGACLGLLLLVLRRLRPRHQSTFITRSMELR